MSLDVGFAAQTPSLPGAGSAAGGLGETFTPDLSTGTGTFTVPLDLPNGPNDIGPKLVLRYDTASPNGPFGRGWSLALPRLLRSTMRGRPRYDDDDTLVLEGSGPLLRTATGGWRPEVDTGDWRVALAAASAVDGFVVTDRAGTRYELGTTADSRIDGPAGIPWSWLVHQIEDNLGNTARFAWRVAGTQRYLESVDYGVYRVALVYESRPDRLRWTRGGFVCATDERCAAIELRMPSAPTPLVRRWDLGYAQSEPSGASLLTMVAMTGVAADGTELSTPTLTMQYTKPSAPRLVPISAQDEGSAPPALDGGGRVELIDWDGDGVPDVLEIGPGGDARVWANLGGAWGRPRTVANLPQLAGDTARAGLVDLDGNGRADAVRVDVPASGYQPRGRDGFERPVQWMRAPSVPLGAPTTRLGDLDGDGIVDLVWSTGHSLLLAHREEQGGWEERPQVVPARADGPPTDLADPHVFLADITGDGTPDIVRVDGRAVTYWPYLGFGTFGAAVRMGSAPVLPFDVDITRVFVVDLDGDGCADVLYLDDRASAVRWWPNCAGDHFEAMRIVPHVPVAAMREVRVADVLATGVPVLCWTGPVRPSGRSHWYALDLLGSQPIGLLATIDNGVGTSTEVAYTTSATERRRDRDAGRLWRTSVPMVLPLVQSTTRVDQTTGRTDVSRFRYHDGRYDDVRREFCGFGEVTQTDPGDEHVPALVTTRRFHIGLSDDGSEPANAEERAAARAVRGRLLDQIHSGEDGMPFDRVQHAWETVEGDEEGVVVPRMRRITTSRYDGVAIDAPASRIETETTAWDADGNALEQIERSFAGPATTSSRTLRTRIDYAVDPTGRYRQRTTRVRQDDGAGGVVADTLTFYDGLPFGQVGSAGLVTARFGLAITDEMAAAVYGTDPPDFAALGYERRSEAPGWWIPLGTYARTVDPQGIVRGALTGLRGAPSQLTLDPTGCYPAEVTDAVGNTVSAEFDPRSYQPVRLTTPSGAVSRAEFDALARLTATIEAGDTETEPTVAYEYRTDVRPVELTVRRRAAGGGAPIETREFLDGDGRLLERRGRDDAGEVVDSSVAYGPRGLPVRQFLPHRLATTEYVAPEVTTPHAELFYDAAGRPVRSVRPDGGVHAVAYGPARIEETDPTGRTVVRHLDATGRIVRTEEPVDDRVLVATFAFDLKGNVVEHTDSSGTTTRFAYDLLGRLLRSDRPGAAQTVVVDPAGNPVETRGGGHSLLRTFDVANRIVAVRHDAPNTEPVLRCTYHDNGVAAPADAGTHTAGGRLVRVEDESGATVLDYDARGRIATKRMRVRDGAGAAAGELVLAMTYRPDGLVDTITYPTEDGAQPVVATYEYDRRARLRRLSGVIDAVEYDLAGRRTMTRYANGAVQRDAHDPLTGWRHTTRLEHGATTLRDVEYHHDLLGNVLAIDSPEPELAWTYRYDERSQLVEAALDASGAGPFTYSYDDAGNLTANSTRGAYRYGEAGAASTLLTTAGGDTFTYDDRGHVRTAPWGTHSVDAEGRLRRIDLTGGGRQEFTYSHNGVLARRRDFDAAGNSTRDVASPDRLVWIENGALVLQFTDGNRIVARHDVAAAANSWLHTDHIGSLVLVTDASGDVVLSQRFDPFGRVLARDGTGAAPQGFATGEAAGPDLVLLGARWYCPSIGRFLSPDPLVANAYDAIAWNAYAYARNNPASYIDPTGRDFWKVFGMVLAAVAIIALIVIVSVFTFGIGTPGAIAIGGVTWGAIFTATMVGVVAGGVIGGIAAARAGGDASDILLGVLVGGAVGGWAAFGAAFAGTAVAGAFGLHGVAGGAVAGGVSGAINGAAMGFASGFAGGKNNGFTDVMEKVLVGAIVGAAIGAALGALSGVTAPKESVRESLAKEFKPQTPPGGAESAPGAGGAGAAPGPTAPVNNFGDAMGKVGGGLAGKAAGAVFPHAASATAGFTGSIITQTVAVDVLTAGPGSLFWDDLQEYLRTHNVDLGPFDFIKGSADPPPP